MHKYLIELIKYTEQGAPTNEYSYDTADTPQDLCNKVQKWKKMKYTHIDDDGTEVVGFSMYKVTPKQGVYEDIQDFATFVTVNGCEYHV